MAWCRFCAFGEPLACLVCRYKGHDFNSLGSIEVDQFRLRARRPNFHALDEKEWDGTVEVGDSDVAKEDTLTLPSGCDTSFALRHVIYKCEKM